MFLQKLKDWRQKKKTDSVAHAAYVAGLSDVVDQYSESLRFKDPQGHGFAAESVNTRMDRLAGKHAEILGGNNERHGPDRIADGRLLQNKTYASASGSVGACFENNRYIYYVDGKPIAVEVPSDQYDSSIRLMEKRILNGEVPGITDPAKATDLIVKGPFSYQTYKNIAKFCTVESLAWDAATGVVHSTGIYSISFVLIFARECWRGKSIKEAAEEAHKFGLKPAALALVTHVATQQIARTQFSSLVSGSVAGIVNTLPHEMVSTVANIGRASPIFGAAAASNVTKMISGNLIAASVTIALYSGMDILKYRKNKITKTRFFKNIAVNTSGLTGGLAGARIGLLGGPHGAIVGGFIGYFLGRKPVSFLMDKSFNDDVELICAANCENFMLSEDESGLLLGALKKFSSKTGSHDGSKQSMEELALKLVIEIVAQRESIELPEIALIN